MESQTVMITRGPRATGFAGQPVHRADKSPARATESSRAESGPSLDVPASGARKCPLHTMFGGPAANVSPGKRLAILAVGLVAYAMFFGTFLYAIGFVANLVVPKGIDTGAPGGVTTSLVVNGLLLSLFVVQHTIMARPAFKRWWTRIVPEAMERSIFVAAASACLMLVFWLWRPLPTVIWSVEQPVLHWALVGVSMVGWLIVLASSFMINHFDLFGLRQTFYGVTGRQRPHVPFVLNGFYRLVRHPLMVGFMVAFWATPTMTVGHLFFAVMTTGYIFFGTAIEERDLVSHLGDRYREYQRRVRGFIPLPRRAPAGRN